MRLTRASGILLHPTSLPGPFGIGDLGPSAEAFVDALAETGQGWWQMLPLGPTGAGNSPYQSLSSYAGNPLLISPELLAADGLLSPADWRDDPALPEDRVDYEAVVRAKRRLLGLAYERFGAGDAAFAAFRVANAPWLDDYALYRALKEAHE
ncbi:MAG TPA: 4-alpha-glucanotransferase, partial [Isosphaeraceae bacterium]